MYGTQTKGENVDTINVYTLAELKEQFPDAYEKVHERWMDGVARSGDIPWSSEVMDSLTAVVEAAGGTLDDWSIGPDGGRCSVTVEDETDAEDEAPVKGADWFFWNVLVPHGYYKGSPGDKVADFPGHCKFTGYCADDDFLEAAYKALGDGDSLTEALEGLADVAAKHMADDLEQQQDEESMEANWGDSRFTEDGIMV
jgi:hypothetical protein